MRLRVLGSSSKGNCYILEGKEETLILECGIPFKEIKKGLNFDLSKVAGCLVTHGHMDHCKAAADMAAYGIDIFTGAATIVTLAGISPIRIHRMKPTEAHKQFNIEGFTVMPFEAEHDVEDAFGFYIYHPEMGKLLFATDTYYIPYSFNGLNHILIECNYDEDIMMTNIGMVPAMATRLLKSHMSLETCSDYLKKTDLSQTQEIVLLHLSDGNSDAAAFRKRIEGVTGKPVYIAEKGLEIEL